ncbi:MAG: PTS sugar transporter subunit IIB [Erysipelotrichaceae bacterium]|nr:PTS sugar transporter subunit IIB [Erysipelotrichaceae bacterium]MDY5251591.1 PTS sugar transporter subunit IIB [Erysipelotrichaceae bacterium]
MIKLLRVDDNLLHGSVAFSWVINLKIHTIIIGDDQVVNDQFMKMTLGLSKPSGVNLLILSVDDAINKLQEIQDSNLNVLAIVNNIAKAVKICEKIPEIKHINIGLIRNKGNEGIQYAHMHLSLEDIELCKSLLNNGVYLEYRLNFHDEMVDVAKVIYES